MYSNRALSSLQLADYALKATSGAGADAAQAVEHFNSAYADCATCLKEVPNNCMPEANFCKLIYRKALAAEGLLNTVGSAADSDRGGLLQEDEKNALLSELYDIGFRLKKLRMEKEAQAALDLHYRISESLCFSLSSTE